MQFRAQQVSNTHQLERAWKERKIWFARDGNARSLATYEEENCDRYP